MRGVSGFWPCFRPNNKKASLFQQGGFFMPAPERVPFKMNRNNALTFCFNALLNPKSASHFSESALAQKQITGAPQWPQSPLR